MADNTKIWPIFRWANGGLSDDLFTGIKNSFYFSNDMEIREDAKSIYPKPVPAYADVNTKVSISATSYQEVKCVFYCSNAYAWTAWWVICLGREIYWIDTDNQANLLCTMSEDICDAEVFNWYIYVSTLTHLYYKLDNWWSWGDMASATDTSVANYGRFTTDLQSNKNHPLYASDVCLCVWDKNIMWRVIRETPSAMQKWFTLQAWWIIRFINELGWYIRAVAVDEPYGSEVLLWDKAANAAPVEIIPLEWFSIIWACIYKWYHYLLSNKWLGLLNWYQYYLLKKADSDVDTTARNNMCVYDDKLFFIANNWIYIYWAKNKNYADVLALWHKVEDWYKLKAIGSYKNWIMITRDNKRVSGNWTSVDVWVNYWLATTWEVQTMCYYWTSMSEIKQSMYLRVWYHIPKQWTESWNIHIYYRTEADAYDDVAEDWQWHELTKPDWLYADWDMRSPFATTLKLNCRFQWIQFKFVLTNCVYDDNWTTKTKDTNLYSADLYYNTMLD